MKYEKKRFISMTKPWRTEAWLSKMAEKGYQLKKIKRATFSFEQAEPMEMEYRLIYDKEEAFGDRINHYKETGWEIAARDGKIIVLSAKTEHSPSEEYLQAGEKKAWKYKDLGETIFIWIMAAFWLYLSRRAIFSPKTKSPINLHSLSANWYAWEMLVFVILMTINGASLWVDNFRYVKRMERKGREAHHGKGRRPIKWDMFVGVFFFMLVITNLFCASSVEQGMEVSKAELSKTPLLDEEQINLLTGEGSIQSVSQKNEAGIFSKEYAVNNWGINQEYHVMKGNIDRDRFMNSVIYDEHDVWDRRNWIKGKEEILTVEGIDRVVCARGEGESYALAAAKGPHILYVEVSKSIDAEKVLAVMKDNFKRL